MKGIRKDMTAWIIIIVVLVTIFYLYNHVQPNRYVDHGEDAPASDELHPIVAKKTETLIEQASDKNINVVITDKVRTTEEQRELYKQGRSENGQIVTYARSGESYHNYGLAVDYALRNHDGEIIWDIHYDGNSNGESDWYEVADIAKELGFDWGGDGDFKDYPHLYMNFGLSIHQLQEGLRPKQEEAKE